jgi:AcrR family transcriptional regulator
VTGEPERHEHRLRNVPTQARSRERLRRVLDAADDVLASEGAAAFSTTRVAEAAEVPIGSVYRFFPDKEAIVEALATRYWSDFEDLVAGAAEADELDPFADPGAFVIDTLAAGFRARPGFLALWFGGLRTEAVRDATRPTRQAIGASIERILARHWPDASTEAVSTATQMVVLAGDGLLREAFRRDRAGDEALLEESKRMLRSYLDARLGAVGL